MESLDNILKGKDSPVVEQPKAEAPAVEVAETPAETPEQKADRERDDRGRFKAKDEGTTPAKPETPEAKVTPKVETKPAPTAGEKAKPAEDDNSEPLDPKAKAYYAKAKDEQRKRQAVEQELARLRAAQQQPQPKIDPMQDPEGFAQRIAQEAEQRSWDRILNLSESQARRFHGDEIVSEAQEAFKEAVQSMPGLYQQLNAQADPYDWVVKWHKREKFLREVQDPDEWTKQREAAIRQRLEAEYAQKQPQAPARPAAPVPPPSLANATSGAGAMSAKTTYEGPTPISSILRR
jgi:hypothetical protein